MFDHEMRDAAERVLFACRKSGLKVATAESCTGGLIAATLTAIAGSSDVVDRAFITYSNEAKREMLGVPWDAILGHGAVSDPVARAMASGALARSNAQLAVSVTGVAGPGGGSAEKPVGLVHFGAVRQGRAPVAERHVFPGDRDGIRRVSVLTALTMLATLVEDAAGLLRRAGLLLDRLRAQAEAGEDLVDVAAVHDAGHRRRDAVVAQELGQKHLVAAAQDRVGIVDHDQAELGGLARQPVGAVPQRGGLADEQRVEPGQRVRVGLGDQLGAHAQGRGGSHELLQRPGVRGRLDLVGIGQDGEAVGRAAAAPHRRRPHPRLQRQRRGGERALFVGRVVAIPGEDLRRHERVPERRDQRDDGSGGAE